MASVDSILGQHEINLTKQATSDRVATDKDTFLKLLVAQLTHQDPLNPVEDKEFIAQLAQFTTVEELQNINTGVESLNESFNAQQTTNAVSLINKLVVAGGDNVQLRGAENFTSSNDYPTIFFTLPRSSAGGEIKVYAADADGNPTGAPVYSADMPAYQMGRREAKWHGCDYNDNPMPDGTYIINITATDADGQPIEVRHSSSGMVIGVETAADGNHKLYLEDGRTVYYTQIDLVLGIYGNGGAGEGTGDGEGEGAGDGEGTETGTTP
ncbi:MAG: flagellar hook assembly protein FlgD [Desulfovibrio sp.]|jgi:flagellar basal-body rod modification protein FlgD|nr:flagellar hook assembly protein FlgD [Desulfovibrio sp.]